MISANRRSHKLALFLPQVGVNECNRDFTRVMDSAILQPLSVKKMEPWEIFSRIVPLWGVYE